MKEKDLNQFQQFEKKQLVIKVTGDIQESNLDEYEKQAVLVLASINTNLVEDEDFAEAEQNVKDCMVIENRIYNAVTVPEKIEKLIARRDILQEKFRSMRLLLTPKIKTEKEVRKGAIASAAMNRINALLINSPVKHGFTIDAKAIREAGKGMKLLSKIKAATDAVAEEEELRLANMEADYLTNMTTIDAKEIEFTGLFPDKKTLALSSSENVEAQIEARIAKYNFGIAEKKRIAEEKAKTVKQVPVEKKVYTPGPFALKFDHKPPAAFESFPEPFTTSQFLPPTPPCLQRYRLELVAKTNMIDTLIYVLSRNEHIISVKVLKWD